MAYELSGGALSIIMSGGHVESPIMQILGMRKMSGIGPTARYRLLISDGLHVNTFAMLATQLNEKLGNGELDEYTVIRISRYITSVVPNPGKDLKRVMIILDVNVVAPGAEVGQRIGSPQALGYDGQSTASSAATPAPAPVAAPPRLPVAARTPPAVGPRQGESNTSISESDSFATQPIPSLVPYFKKWAIKARVTNKSAVRTWSNPKQNGKLFSFDVLDKFGEIRITAFKEHCDKFYDMIEVGKVYIISQGFVKAANKQFSTLDNDYEITLNNDSQITPVTEDASEIPTASFNFKPLSTVRGKNTNTHVDIIGICRNVGDLVTITARASKKEVKKRELTLVDKSLVSVVLTIWGNEAEDFVVEGQPVIAVKGGTINEFDGAKSISASSASALIINPDIPEAHSLRAWYDKDGRSLEYKNVSGRSAGPKDDDGKFITLAEINDLQAEVGNAAVYFNCKATLVCLKSDKAIYNACPSENCNKKVVDLSNELYRCEKCNREYDVYCPRLILSMGIADYSALQWVTCFHDIAEEILGHPAAELNELSNEDLEAFRRVFEEANFSSYVFRLRAQGQMYNDEQRLKITVVKALPIDHAAYAKMLIKEMKQLYVRD